MQFGTACCQTPLHVDGMLAVMGAVGREAEGVLLNDP